MKTNGYTVDVEYITNQVVDILDKSENHREFISMNEYIDYYRRGNCYFFALALHYELGYQMVGIMGRWKKAGHMMARGSNGLLYDIGGGYLEIEWENHYSYTLHDMHDKPMQDISEKNMIKMLNGSLHDEVSYNWKSYNQMEIEKGIAIIRAYPKIYNPIARNIALGRHY